MEGIQSHRSHVAAQNLPGEVVEQVLAHVPFQERVRAASVCRAWSQHLSQRGLPLWQAASIAIQNEWQYEPDEDDCDRIARQLRVCLPLQRWLCRHGNGLLQLQCGTSFHIEGFPEDGLLAALLTTLAASAPSLQALRLEGNAGRGLADSSLVGIVSMGRHLRQLALVRLLHVSDDALMAALAHLPFLQDLAIMFADAEEQQSMTSDVAETFGREPVGVPAPDFMRLLDGVAMSCSDLRTLALGHLPADCLVPRWSDIAVNEQPVPAAMMRLIALTSMALHNVGWTYAADSLPRLPQLRRLSLRADFDQAAKDGPDLHHQLRTLTTLEALQVMLPDWPGQLPRGLTQLVVAPTNSSSHAYLDQTMWGYAFLCNHLPHLSGLHHLVFHGSHDIGVHSMQQLSAAAGALPHLISLHLVQCGVSAVPVQLCALSRLQLLDLSHNRQLALDGYKALAQAPLRKLASCRRLDLRCRRPGPLPYNPLPLQADTVKQLAGMPALEQLALPLAEVAAEHPAACDQVHAQLE